MPSWPEQDFSTPAITPYSYESVGSLLNTGVSSQALSTAWPVANTAYFIPFRLRQRSVFKQIVVGGGSTAGGNFDVGIYDLFGNRIVSSGSTAKVTSGESIANITDTTLGRGVYYMAMAADITTNYIAISPFNISILKLCGIKELTSAFPLPATVTLVTLASSYLPSIALYRTSL